MSLLYFCSFQVVIFCRLPYVTWLFVNATYPLLFQLLNFFLWLLLKVPTSCFGKLGKNRVIGESDWSINFLTGQSRIINSGEGVTDALGLFCSFLWFAKKRRHLVELGFVSSAIYWVCVVWVSSSRLVCFFLGFWDILYFFALCDFFYFLKNIIFLKPSLSA